MAKLSLNESNGYSSLSSDIKKNSATSFHLSMKKIPQESITHLSTENQFSSNISNSVNKSSTALFKARPVPKCVPFIPKRSTKPLTFVDENFILHSELRAQLRSSSRNIGKS